MNTEQDVIRKLAERVTQKVAAGKANNEEVESATSLASLSASLKQIERRLVHIESHLQHDETCHANKVLDEQSVVMTAPSRSPWLSSIALENHPSVERFGVGEAVAELVNYFEREKTCDVEPGGKPCDHCAMCSSRGF